jgi:hypothetical protein
MTGELMEINVLNKSYVCRTKEHLWFQETKDAVLAVGRDELSTAEISERSENENFFNAASKSRAKEISQTVNRRMEVIDDGFISYFIMQNIEIQKVLVLIMVMLEDRTFFDFMYEIFREKLIIGDYQLNDAEIIRFIHNLQEKDDKAATWSDASKQKLRLYIKNLLRDSGLLEMGKQSSTILRPIITSDFEEFLNNEELIIVKNILMGDRA